MVVTCNHTLKHNPPAVCFAAVFVGKVFAPLIANSIHATTDHADTVQSISLFLTLFSYVCTMPTQLPLISYVTGGINKNFVMGNFTNNKNDYGQISSGHIIPFGDSQDIISFCQAQPSSIQLQLSWLG